MTKHLIILVVISLFLVGISPLIIKTTITSQAQLSAVRTGFPFAFVEQKSSLTPPEYSFPLELRVLSPWENPTRIIWSNLALSVFMAGVVVEALWRVTRRIIDHVRRG